MDNLREFLAFVNNGWEWFSGLAQAEGSYYNEINFLNSCAYDDTFRKEPERHNMTTDQLPLSIDQAIRNWKKKAKKKKELACYET